MRDLEEMATINIEEEGNRQAVHHQLLLSITLDGEIVQFNQECERVTAYPRDEVLHKKLSDILLPVEYLPRWNALIDTITKTRQIDEFALPLKTKQDTLIPITWNGFFIKDEQGNLNNICLLGTSTQSHDSIDGNNAQDPLLTKTSHQNDREATNEKQQNTISVTSLSGQHEEKEELTEKIIFKGEPPDDAIEQPETSSLKSIEKIVDNTSKQIDNLSQIIKGLSGKYETINERLGNLERKDERSEKNQKRQVKHLKLMDNGYKRATRKNMKTSPMLRFPRNESSVTEKKPSFFSDPLGYTRQHQNLDRKIQECDHRQKDLEAFEAQLLQEKKIFDSRIEEFLQWRDKLEQLEMEIEKRRQELLTQDMVMVGQDSPISPEVITHESKVIDVVASESPNFQQILDGIPQSAAIVQRGILKQINTTFAELIGYPVNEIVEKNFFDFIAVDGLAGVEKYYLNRLKGESISSYTTVFSTKENEKVFVEVTVKPTIYNGEKAEIAIMTILESQKQEA